MNIKGIFVTIHLSFHIGGYERGGTMFCKTFTGAVLGIDGKILSVEADVKNGLPIFQLVGVSSNETKEARERVKVSIENSGYVLPPKHVTVNISPGEIKKEGTAFDLPMAIAVLSAFDLVPSKNLDKFCILGELSLDGKVNPVRGLLSIAEAAGKAGITSMIVPKENAFEASAIEGLKIYAVSSLKEAVLTVIGKNEENLYPSMVINGNEKRKKERNFSNNILSMKFTRGACVAAAGGHNFMMTGNHTNLQKDLACYYSYLLPGFSKEEQTENLKIVSVSGNIKASDFTRFDRPFVTVQSDFDITNKAIKNVLFSKMVQSHNGIMFLTAFEEMHEAALNIMREAVDTGKTTGYSTTDSISYPSDFRLISALKPCDCGMYPDKRRCFCSQKQVDKYMKNHIKGFLEHYDVFVMTDKTESRYEGMSDDEILSEDMKNMHNALIMQYRRFKTVRFNAHMNHQEVIKYCIMTEKAEKYLKDYIFGDEDDTVEIPEAYYKALKVARTIADMRTAENIDEDDIKEALSYLIFTEQKEKYEFFK